jgi:hypothetical protein
MHGVPGTLSDDMPEKRLADKGQVTDQIEYLVAAAFVGEPQSSFVEDGRAVEADGIFKRCAADETHVTHLVKFPGEAEGASGSDVDGIAFRGHFHFERLTTHERVIEENIAG